MCGRAFLAASPANSRRRVPARRPRQVRPGRPSRPVLGQARASFIGRQPPDGLRVGRFALGGGRRGGPRVHRGACCAGISQLRWFLRPGGRLSLAGEPWVEISNVFRGRRASCRWIFQPVARPRVLLVAFVAPLGEVAAVGHADDGKAKGERREEKPDEPQPSLPHVHPLATAESTMSAIHRYQATTTHAASTIETTRRMIDAVGSAYMGMAVSPIDC